MRRLTARLALAPIACAALALLAPGVARTHLVRTVSALDAAAVPAAGAVAPSTRRMAERLADITATSNVMENRFASRRRLALLRQTLAGPSGAAGGGMRDTAALANEMLGAGLPEEAKATMDLRLRDPAVTGQLRDEMVHDVREFGALCDLRIGERDNCVRHRGAESCLVPIRGSGIHGDQQGSRAAMAAYTSLIGDVPERWGLRWLLNIASMTVGEYPDGVPPKLLIPPAVFDSEYDIGRFHDVAPAAGLARASIAGGSIVDDFDGDGLLDVVVSSWGLEDQIHFYRNDGDGTFTDRTVEAGLTGIVGGLNIVQADYDNDGHPDILVLRGAWLGPAGRYPKSLLRNRGDGTFEDVTEKAGLLTFHPTQVGVWADYDGDGWLDLFVGNESTPSDKNESELWHNNRDGTFTNRALLLGDPDLGFVKGAAWGDYDNDGRPDLLVTGQGSVNRLFHNDGPRTGAAGWSFTDVTGRARISQPWSAFPCWFFDYDNDGWLDVFIAGYKPVDVGEIAKMYMGLPHDNEVPRLYHNEHDGTFRDVTQSARLDRVALVMGSNFGDLDGDGFPDLYLGTGAPDLRLLLPNRMFRNDGGKSFQDVTTSGGFGHIQKGHAVSFADLDNDGDQDVFEVMGGAFDADTSQNVLYENPGHGNHWVTIRLEGRRANRSAIGARLRVRVKTAHGGRDVYTTVSSGGSFGASPLRREIGLGDALAIERIDVTWPGSRTAQVLRDVAMDRFYVLVEDEPLRELPLHSFALPHAPR